MDDLPNELITHEITNNLDKITRQILRTCCNKFKSLLVVEKLLSHDIPNELAYLKITNIYVVLKLLYIYWKLNNIIWWSILVKINIYTMMILLISPP